MSIKPFVKNDYAILDAYDGVLCARQSDSIDIGIVIVEEDRPIGVLTASDIAKKQHQIIIDCLTQKPSVASHDRIADVLDIMESSGHGVLMVYDHAEFVGTISKNDIMHHIKASLVQQKLKVQSAAHDLKNPLASIKMIATLLDENLKLTENRELVQYLTQSCDFAQKIIDEILVTEQIADGAALFSEEDFDGLVEGCLPFFSKELQQKKISLSKKLAFGKSVLIDRMKFERVIHNLVSNSIKFCHRNGAITISTASFGGMLQFTVKDNGIGIPKHLQEKVFDRFTVARRTGTEGEQSTGLGMHIIRHIVQMHGGHIKLDSDGLNGTSVSIFLNLTGGTRDDMPEAQKNMG